MRDKAIVTDYLVLAASLDLNEAVAKFLDDNEKNVRDVLQALAKYTDAIEAAPIKEQA